jgi:peptide chain release factor 1
MQVLRARLLQLAQDEHDAAAIRRASFAGRRGWSRREDPHLQLQGEPGHDHRIGFTIYRLQEVLAGDLDDVVDALAADERARQLAGDE